MSQSDFNDAANQPDGAFLRACRGGSIGDLEHVDVLKKLNDNPAAIRWKDEWGNTGLMISAMSWQRRFVEAFIAKGSALEETSNAGQTVLAQCVQVSWPEMLPIVGLLVQSGANIEARDSNGNTPLLLAAKGPFNAMIEFLLKKGAQPDARNAAGQSADDIMRADNDRAMAANAELQKEGSMMPRDVVSDIAPALKLLADARAERAIISGLENGTDQTITVRKPLALKK